MKSSPATSRTKILSDKVFAVLFGTSEERIRSTAGSLINATDLRYDPIEGTSRDQLILAVLKLMESSDLRLAGEHRLGDWEAGWEENLQEFEQSGYALETLIPKYNRRDVPIRLNREYVMPAQPDFIRRYTEIFRTWICQTYLEEYHSIYEFGCGTGHNLAHLADLYPEKTLYGFDWTQSSQKILGKLASHYGMKIRGRLFNFFSPDYEIDVEAGSAVLTFGALEQVGSNYDEYLRFILDKKPNICVDVIGIQELYDPSHLLDYLALLYHVRRNYLNGYLNTLRRLEAKGQLQIVKAHRHHFGNLYNDSLSYVVWKCT